VRRWLVILAAVPALAALPASAALAAPAAIHPGAPWTDQNHNPLQLHGLGIVKVGNTFYGFGEDKVGENQSDTSFRAIPCYSSTDLATWTYLRESLIHQKSGDLGPHRIVERPKVIYNAPTRRYVMYLHIDDPAYAEAKVGVATSTGVCGPYSYRGSFRPLGQQSRDIGLFQDNDGTGYLLTEDRAHGLRIDRLSADYLSVTQTVTVLGRFEAPAMVRAGGRFYLLGSHLTGWKTNDNEYTTATSLAGPWSVWRTFAPAGSKTFNSQTANIITVTGSKAITYVYAGDRWTPDNLGNSPLVWLPLTISGTSVSMSWHDTWRIDTATGTWS
jgi:Glycosyl hydrolases family 43